MLSSTVFIIVFIIAELLLSVFSNDRELIILVIILLKIVAVLPPFRGFYIIGRSFSRLLEKPGRHLL